MNDDEFPCQHNTLLCPLEDDYSLRVSELGKTSLCCQFYQGIPMGFFLALSFKSFLIKLKYIYIFFLPLTPPVFIPCFLSNSWPPYINLLSINLFVWISFHLILDLGTLLWWGPVEGFFPGENYCLCSPHPYLSVVSSRVGFFESIYFHVSIYVRVFLV